ncbi:1-deoxy-D-xylulose-5-phosphate reductoisomerase [Candidatus Velamenicoccus archaeovorus]|uniref:1-deoxy-D-xylulose 5-phosphate reductoisomerase n=1 Tax=Velamenicoccus archaeovorus TaxID=1930593 RepID=A0A410P2W1_VELA1|nr:1-deoxy-D-xylulose-5-phosphate reductoisomerase [Candidatus Velamenicoccus archaeovorus]QAT16432.1 1-deoxy-D-xylulose-5-phosphate reductoisomerase [Candidatus Velamenicoccus archaeovorus]
MKKNVVILGSSGSIGESALSVALRFKDRVRVVGLSVNTRTEKLESQMRVCAPRTVAIADEEKARTFRPARRKGVKVLAGRQGVCALAALKEADIVLIAVVGAEAIYPLWSAIRAGKTVALANKESIVVGGALVADEARLRGARIIPIDSEQSAIFQCLEGYNASMVKRVYLTASGGPLVDYPRGRLKNVSQAAVLAHPRWKMGPKITVDSATLMNKGLEVIEAKNLFGLPLDKIRVLVHRQALVHSMVEYMDGSILAQLGVTDMKLPIQYALSYPERWANNGALSLDLLRMGSLDFSAPDMGKFPCLRLAYEAARSGGSVPCVLNAANEVAVASFLAGRLTFGRIANVIEETLASSGCPSRAGSLEDIFAADAFGRRVAQEKVRKYAK